MLKNNFLQSSFHIAVVVLYVFIFKIVDVQKMFLRIVKIFQ